MIVTRFAPSPTGLLHLGHVAAAVFARGRGKRFLVRMEDIDRGRCRGEFAAGILEDLGWLGVWWDGAVWVQSEHMGEYAGVLGGCGGEGLVYPCFCTRADVLAAGGAPHGGEVVYPRTCRGLSEGEREGRIAAGEAHAWRLDMGEAVRRVGALTFHEEGEGRVACAGEAFGDVVLGRKDVPASYHLCVAHDDAVQGVTLVTRGVDLRGVTAEHRVLQALMGWAEPGYAHHRLLLGADGRRLAKRDGALTVRALRERGVTAAEVLAMAGAG